ncbi:Asp-tRNA(Asn)/Glu-tRNA(Gln) amidotransferase GatCAB subunit C [bacterium (Candidatus Torokbacteria) CG_4_10_14_0_2_um_filter_35_8]|nr:MAG: Asp-tRNA(Asn)/Glu-tRNA(Gln) amidotransferase GatCAB subunit C [bacterium (Candidatus Torokbacteria) CG_4_10_14_0_2_um_filter_35_8]
MAKLTRKEVEHIAKLSRIELTKEEVEKFRRELSSILDYVEKLKEVDTEKIGPTFQVTGVKNVFRPDEIEKSLEREKLLDNAPDKDDGYLKVKKVFN